MENATKALLIAGGVLIAILIISLFVILLQNTKNVSKQYDENISIEQISTFNNNFTKYIGQNLTIHDVVTICNFAKNNNIHIITNIVNEKSENNISEDINQVVMPTYKIKIIKYNKIGFIDEIKFEKNT